MPYASTFANHFLIAMPGLRDPNFSRTVTYLCEHTEQGAMGIVINRPLEIRLGEILEQLDIEVTDPVAVGPGRQCFLRDPSGNRVELNQPGA